jgi:hypothetical protein
VSTSGVLPMLPCKLSGRPALRARPGPLGNVVIHWMGCHGRSPIAWLPCCLLHFLAALGLSSIAWLARTVQEREEAADLRAQLLHMTAERDTLLRGASATALGVGMAIGAHDGGTGKQDVGADFISPFGGFSPFTPGRDSV